MPSKPQGIVAAGKPVRFIGHENGDQQYRGRQDDFNMHFCSHPGGSMADSAVEPTGHSFLQSVLL